MVNLRKFLKPYKDAGGLHCLLSIRRFVDDHLFLTKKNQVGVVLQLAGIDDESLTAATLESYTRRIAAAWRSFDEPFRIYQYVVKQDRAPIQQPASSNPVAAETITNRTDFLESRSHSLYSIQLFVVILLDPGKLHRSHELSNRSATRKAVAQLRRNQTDLHHHVDSFVRTIGDLLGITVLDKAAAFQFFRLLANLDQDLAAAGRLKHDSHVDYYLSSVPVSCTSESMRIGDADIEVLSLREPPTATFPNVLRDLLATDGNFVLCSEFKRISNEKAIATIRAAQNHFHWSQWVSDLPSILSMVLNRGKRENVIADKTALNDVEDLDKTLARIKNDGEYLGEFSVTVVLYGWGDETKVRTAATDVVKIFGNHEASLIRETYNALNSYLSIFPGNQAFNLRRTWLLSGNYADLSFAYAPSIGEKRNQHLGSESLVVLETNEGTPYHFNIYEGDRLGALLFGAPGAGKSVLANLFIDHSQKDEPYTFILDLGGSYRQITRKHSGTYVHMRFGDDQQSFRINPFVLPATADNLQFLFTFVRLLLTNAGYEPSVDDDRELYEAVESMYVFLPSQRALRNLVNGLPTHLSSVLRSWIGDGQYGSVFDNVEDTLTFSRFQTFDFQGMDELYPQVLEPLLFYIFQRISQVVYDPELVTAPKQLWADEVWRFLSHGTARQYLVAAGKTWRKHNGGIGLITQSAADLQNAGVLDLINEICPTKILLANPGADLASYQRMFKLNEKEVDLFAQLVPKRQFLVKSASRAKVLNVNLDPRAYWEYTNSPFDNERRRIALEKHGSKEGLKVLAASAN
jgi:type IV secretion system protein TrbE